MSFLSSYFGYSRQYFYKNLEKANDRLLMTEIIIAFVSEEREDAPEIGSKKLYKLYRDSPFDNHLGRDAFINILRDYNLLLKKHQYKVRTTDSNHTNLIYPNLISNLEPTKPNEVWVADITYIRLFNGFCFLSLITDMYSRRIMGFDLSPDLKYYHVRDALSNAILNAEVDLYGLIHHSDRGFQYTYKSFIDTLKEYGIMPSMTQSGDPLENPIAERVNGILKKE
ncbi:MAG: IS3 family transposase [Bacteroidales bacterium]